MSPDGFAGGDIFIRDAFRLRTGELQGLLFRPGTLHGGEHAIHGVGEIRRGGPCLQELARTHARTEDEVGITHGLQCGKPHAVARCRSNAARATDPHVPDGHRHFIDAAELCDFDAPGEFPLVDDLDDLRLVRLETDGAVGSAVNEHEKAESTVTGQESTGCGARQALHH
jgi:hypothetical protein